jgi:hypothetical protein
MDPNERQELEADGLITEAADGAPAVRVFLHYLPSLPTLSAPARREVLWTRFSEAADGEPVELDHATLSESGQAIEALVPIDDFHATLDRLAAPDDLQVDLARTFQINDD